MLKAVLLELANVGVSVLSMHDGLLCCASEKRRVVEAMIAASNRVLADLALGDEPLEVVEKAIIGA